MPIVNRANTTETIMNNRIIDLHSHLLPGIDDGSKTIEESVKLIQELHEKGVTDIILTSHYMVDTDYSKNQFERNQLLEFLKGNLGEIDVHLYLGSEVYLTPNVVDLLKRHEISTLNQSKYLLVELPLHEYLNQYPLLLCELNSYGVVPIIAHPERYAFLQKDKARIKEILEFDCLIQCNLASLTGKYGRHSKKLVKWLLKNNLVQFIATDTHHSVDPDFDKAVKILKRIVGAEKAEELLWKNQENVLKNGDVFSDLTYVSKEATKWKKK